MRRDYHLEMGLSVCLVRQRGIGVKSWGMTPRQYDIVRRCWTRLTKSLPQLGSKFRLNFRNRGSQDASLSLSLWELAAFGKVCCHLDSALFM